MRFIARLGDRTRDMTFTWTDGQLDGPTDIVADWSRRCLQMEGRPFGPPGMLLSERDHASNPVVALYALTTLPEIAFVEMVEWPDGRPPELEGAILDALDPDNADVVF